MTRKYDKIFYKIKRVARKPKLQKRFAHLAAHRRQLKNAAEKRLDPPKIQGYDPELLYVECGNCGAPVIWEKGRTTALIQALGIDPIELDPYCLLLTDSCPQCKEAPVLRARLFHLGYPFFSIYGNA